MHLERLKVSLYIMVLRNLSLEWLVSTRRSVRPIISDNLVMWASQIHGRDGLGGVEGLPASTDETLRARLETGRQVRALDAVSTAVRQAGDSGIKVTIATCGPLTNLALFICVYPDLLECIERIVFMGGGVGMGNRSSTSGMKNSSGQYYILKVWLTIEFNVLCDREALLGISVNSCAYVLPSGSCSNCPRRAGWEGKCNNVT